MTLKLQNALASAHLSASSHKCTVCLQTDAGSPCCLPTGSHACIFLPLARVALIQTNCSSQGKPFLTTGLFHTYPPTSSYFLITNFRVDHAPLLYASSVFWVWLYLCDYSLFSSLSVNPKLSDTRDHVYFYLLLYFGSPGTEIVPFYKCYICEINK